MIWNKLKKNLKERFADDVKKDVDFFITDYAGSWSMGRGWITINGTEIVNFSTAESDQIHNGNPWNELTKDNRFAIHAQIEDSKRTPGLLIEKGEFSRGDFTDCCFQFIDLSIIEAQESNHPIIRMLAVLDRRTGKRKLKELFEIEQNPLVKYFLNYRIRKGRTTAANKSFKQLGLDE